MEGDADGHVKGRQSTVGGRARTALSTGCLKTRPGPCRNGHGNYFAAVRGRPRTLCPPTPCPDRPCLPLFQRALLLVLLLVAVCCCPAGEAPRRGDGRGLRETIIGANVILKGTTTGPVTDIDGRFELLLNELPPYTRAISFIGYQQQEVVVESLDKELKFKLSADQVLLKEAEVVGSRIGDKQKQAPLTVETWTSSPSGAPSGDFTRAWAT